MSKILVDCEMGISGDMIVAALLDLGADREVLDRALTGLSGEGVKVRIGRKSRSGIDCCDFDVILDKEHANPDHDMRYLYGHTDHIHNNSDDGLSEEHHSHKDIHGGDGGTGEEEGHGHRRLADIEKIIKGLDMRESARALALKTFRILGEAEAKAHGTDLENVHFHEVGALDSIADIVAASVCFDDLSINDVIIPKLCEGTGTVRTRHGILPVPVPAVLNIVSEHGIPMEITGRSGELVTPTGAAFAAAVMTSTKLPSSFKVKKCGYGAGKREYEIPSILRMMFIEDEGGETAMDGTGPAEDHIIKLETNIDDSTGEVLGYTSDLLFEAGARDVYFLPAYMKKNRPAWVLNVITDEDKVSVMEDIIFRETTTIGIRRSRMERTVLERREEVLDTPLGRANVKICRHKGRDYIYPEYESMVKLAKEHDLPLKEVYDRLKGIFDEQ
ncbi:MAG: nickel pincer cofactor biosynthesis protein LarC [Lachnospiraceae bacterium]|nr:nickel pincer cofactor biosynthesis protein LarC [Lachnospiraceae bacterium]